MLELFVFLIYVGVLHKVENMPRTKQVAFDIRKYLYGIDATKFVSLLDRYGLGYYLAPGVTNFTVLAPENDSIDEGSLPDNLKKAWLSYHIVHGQWFPDQLHDRQLLPSEYKSPQLNDQAQRIPIGLYETRKSSIFFGNARSQNAPSKCHKFPLQQLLNPTLSLSLYPSHDQRQCHLPTVQSYEPPLRCLLQHCRRS